MNYLSVILNRAFLSSVFLFAFYINSFGYQDSVSSQIRFRLEYDEPQQRQSIRNTKLLTNDEIHTFYANREFVPVWSKDGVLKELAYELRFEIRQAKYDGLNPKDYHYQLIDTFIESMEQNKESQIANSDADLADLDILMTDAFFQLANHLEFGKVDHSKLKADWEIEPIEKKISFGEVLCAADEEGSLRPFLVSLYPKFQVYRKGREVLRAMENIEEKDSLDWKTLKINKSIKINDSHSSIPEIRERLKFWGFLDSLADEQWKSKNYDSLTFEAVKNYQHENGMEPDGVIGNLTIQSLNQSPAMLMDKIAVNLERMRWLPDTVRNSKFILVNIANFQLDYINNLDTIHSARVIVGKKYHESPIFRADMSYIVFSPYWNIPYSITRSEILPAVRKNPNYLQEKHMEVVTTSGQVVNPASIDFSSKSFPYLIRQKPGEWNSLGLVKFMFPNKHNVYIHDTPGRSLFVREERALSHGCIRIQNPADFAAVLLQDRPEWTATRIATAMHQDHEQIVNLDRKIPVVLLYLTFWSDTNGKGHFRPDIYGRDDEVLAALRN